VLVKWRLIWNCKTTCLWQLAKQVYSDKATKITKICWTFNYLGLCGNSRTVFHFFDNILCLTQLSYFSYHTSFPKRAHILCLRNQQIIINVFSTVFLTFEEVFSNYEVFLNTSQTFSKRLPNLLLIFSEILLTLQQSLGDFVLQLLSLLPASYT